jgi:hypothetical protein
MNASIAVVATKTLATGRTDCRAGEEPVGVADINI